MNHRLCLWLVSTNSDSSVCAKVLRRPVEAAGVERTLSLDAQKTGPVEVIMPVAFLPKRRQIPYNLAPRLGADGQLMLAAPEEMSMKFKMLALAVFVPSLFVLPAIAHHSFAMFDAEQTVQFSGTVRELQWTNPHSWLQITVQNERGEAIEWSLEMGSPGDLARSGWRPRTVVPGDEITVTLHPLNDGSPGGQLLTAVLPNGEALGE